MARHYITLLEAAITAPDLPLYRLELLSARERRMLLEDFNATATELADKALPVLFEARVARAQKAIALGRVAHLR